MADSYPLTLNALVAGCNQKTSRDPVIEASEAEVQGALDRLKGRSLVMESSGGRVMRYAHNVGKVLAIPPQSVALLATLFLRGAQTAGELRIHSERLHKFGDILSVDAFLRELAERPAGGLVVELSRAPGARETRWAHLLSGDAAVAVAAAAAAAADPGPAGDLLLDSELAAMRATIDGLRAEVDTLKGTVAKLCEQLGITP